MSQLILYLVIAVAILLLAAWLARETSARDEFELEAEQELAKCLFDFNCLEMINRIFDPADYRWLHDELCFAQGAELLARQRKRLAIQWLKALRSSFKELIRVPESSAIEEPPTELSGWELLRLTLRFQLLLGYALLVVRLFGPYHQLVPHFGGFQTLRGLGLTGSRKTAASVE